MYYYNPSKRDPKELVPGVFARTFWGEEMLAAVVNLEPEAELPMHSHPHEQLGIVIEGEIEFTIDSKVQVLKPGDVYIIPSEVKHGARTFDHEVKVMDVFSPVREEYKF